MGEERHDVTVPATSTKLTDNPGFVFNVGNINRPEKADDFAGEYIQSAK